LTPRGTKPGYSESELHDLEVEIELKASEVNPSTLVEEHGTPEDGEFKVSQE